MHDLKKIGDSVISAVKIHVAKEIDPLRDTQRDLISRLDRQSQQLSALQKEVASLQRKLANKKEGVVYAFTANG
jgi:TolA-binding protein